MSLYEIERTNLWVADFKNFVINLMYKFVGSLLNQFEGKCTSPYIANCASLYDSDALCKDFCQRLCPSNINRIDKNVSIFIKDTRNDVLRFGSKPLLFSGNMSNL